MRHDAPVRDGWELLQADDQEAGWFADLGHARACVVGPAAPPNRFRRVHELRAGGRTYFLKEFHYTQWKNRVRSRLTAPRCELDGERERHVADALLQRGFGVARPVAFGRTGSASFYLCAALPGESLRSLLERHAVDPGLARRVAQHCGAMLAAGVRLPDLSADHLFVDPTTGAFGVIDLHNGGLGPTRSPRAAARLLRRFARSVAGLGVARGAALRFGCRLLAAAAYPRSRRRAAIERVPPFDTHGRYEVAGRAGAYRDRSAQRTARELRLLRAVWPGHPGQRVLDSPCGAGRLAAILGEFGVVRIGADRARAMLRASATAAPGDPLVQADAAALPFRARSCDGVVVFRFLHHLPAATAKQVVTEAARVAERFVVLSFFHPVSLHGASRTLRRWLTGRAKTRYALRHATLTRWLRAEGFTPCGTAAEVRFVKDFWVAAFVRTEHAGTAPRLP